ncbi:hypothetical protein Taro_048654, partial [Colocasia esculenta]|nr:hypothetical protein [Colocasia esculenta]
MGASTRNSPPRALTGAPFPASFRDVPSHSLSTFAYKKAQASVHIGDRFPIFSNEGLFGSSPNRKTPQQFSAVCGNEREAMCPTRASHLHETRTPLSSLGGCVEIFFSPTLKDSENKCVLINKSLTSSPKR